MCGRFFCVCFFLLSVFLFLKRGRGSAFFVCVCFFVEEVAQRARPRRGRGAKSGGGGAKGGRLEGGGG